MPWRGEFAGWNKALISRGGVVRWNWFLTSRRKLFGSNCLFSSRRDFSMWSRFPVIIQPWVCQKCWLEGTWVIGTSVWISPTLVAFTNACFSSSMLWLSGVPLVIDESSVSSRSPKWWARTDLSSADESLPSCWSSGWRVRVFPSDIFGPLSFGWSSRWWMRVVLYGVIEPSVSTLVVVVWIAMFWDGGESAVQPLSSKCQKLFGRLLKVSSEIWIYIYIYILWTPNLPLMFCLRWEQGLNGFAEWQ